jgi:hypothetical protein
MSKVIAIMSMSLDGYVADRNDGVGEVFDHLAGRPSVLGNPTVIAGVGVTHLRYPVRKV